MDLARLWTPKGPHSPSNLHYTGMLENRLQAIITLIVTYCTLAIYVRVSIYISISQIVRDTNRHIDK